MWTACDWTRGLTARNAQVGEPSTVFAISNTMRSLLLVLMLTASGCSAQENVPQMNRLADSNSPYLLQHADNPVDWYPWGDEAFEAARTEDKPIFLSIGYATCHWCHVMEHESFEDNSVAALMNATFINIKVDREERPDIDGVYMSVAQAITGRGGWPLTILMTPDRKPFFAGTYIPKESRYGQMGMMDLIPRVAQSWRDDRDGIVYSAEEITQAVHRNFSDRPPGEALGEETLTRAFEQLRRRYDADLGGFGTAPKFPTPHNLLFLLRYWKRSGNAQALEMVETTLQAMRSGGIWDHVGYGFHRYSTNRQWLLPHFEKMLYDQALMAMAYTEAYQATGDAQYRETAELIFEYIQRDMTSPEGIFYSAEDADSVNRLGEKEEGAFYVWSESELREALRDEDATFARRAFGTTTEGNFADEATGQPTGDNVLHRPATPGGDAERLEAIRQRLFDVRERRLRPLLDDKVLTDWNGLMIAALSKAAVAFDEPRYAQQASRAADFFLSTMRTTDGLLLHRYRNDDAGITAHLDDYAFLVWGLFELYEATFNEYYLDEALNLHRTMNEHFADEDGGGYFFTADGSEALLFRQKEFYDGAIPSGNSVAMLNGLRLSRVTGDVDLERAADNVGSAVAELNAQPASHAFMMTAVDFAVGPSLEVVIAGERDGTDTDQLVSTFRQLYAPNAVALLRSPGTGDAPLIGLAPFTEFQIAQNGRATAYVCERQTCQAPTSDPETMVRHIQGQQ